MIKDYQEILDFWFKEATPEQWFKQDDTFDTIIANRYAETHRKVVQGEYAHWRNTIQGRLAEIIVIDQFSRNLYRNDPKAYRYDEMALVLTQEALKVPDIHDLAKIECSFLYMPLMHSESLVIHEEALSLFEKLGLETNYEFEKQHQQIIARFGRYPHRNKVLGRQSTAEEIAFLKEPNSSF